CRADETWQEIGAAEIREQPDLREALREAGLLGGDARGAGQCKVGARAGSRAIDRGDHRLWHCSDGKDDLLTELQEGFDFRHVLAFASSTKNLNIATSAKSSA